ncbi:MAG: flippase [Ruminococcus sp.]|nr:flippase [Ruminococcus sp.]
MKSLARNSIYNIIYKCLNVVFPLITAGWVSRILMAEGIGKVSSAQNIVQYFTILAALGLPTYGTKVVSALNGKTEEQSKAFSELFIINAVSTLICTAVYYIMIVSFPYFVSRWSLFAVCGLAIPFNIINVDWFYQGKEEYGYIMARSLIIKTLSLIACFGLVRQSGDVIVYAAITTFVTVANYIFNIINIRKYVTFNIKGVDVIQHIKPVFIMLSASIAIEIYTLADTTMLTFFYSDSIVGYYANAIKGVRVIKTLVSAICAVFLPRLSYYYANGQKKEFDKLINSGIKILAYISIPTTLGVALVAGDFVPILFGTDFYESVLATRILSISIISVAFSNFLGYQVLVTVGKEKQMMISTIIGAIVNIILNFALIIPFKHNGVAFASVVTELCVTLYQIIAIRGIFEFEIDKKFTVSLVISNITMVISVIFCMVIFNRPVLRLITSVGLGILLYGIVSILTKNELVIPILFKAVKRKHTEQK